MSKLLNRGQLRRSVQRTSNGGTLDSYRHTSLRMEGGTDTPRKHLNRGQLRLHIMFADITKDEMETFRLGCHPDVTEEEIGTLAFIPIRNSLVKKNSRQNLAHCPDRSVLVLVIKKVLAVLGREAPHPASWCRCFFTVIFCI